MEASVGRSGLLASAGAVLSGDYSQRGSRLSSSALSDEAFQTRSLPSGCRRAVIIKADTPSSMTSEEAENVERPQCVGERALAAYRTGRSNRTFAFSGSHWTQNQVALDTMKEMSFKYAMPALQPRLTKFHSTQVPVLVVFNLLSTEVGRLAILDTFWKRIVQHPMVWQGIHCRDYGTKRCVWRTLHGRAGSEKCLCHLNTTNPSKFRDVCREITAIPGRSNKELLDSYCNWRSEQQAVMEQVRRRAALTLKQESSSNMYSIVADATGANLPSIPDETALPPQPWTVRAHCSYGLGVGHGHGVPYGSQMEKAVPVLKASAWLYRQKERRRVRKPSAKRAEKISPR